MVQLLIYCIVLGLVAYLVWWLIDFVGLPEPFNKVAKVIVALFAVVFLLEIVFGLTGLIGSGNSLMKFK